MLEGLKLLLWKNAKIQSRSKKQLLVEIFAPTLFSFIYVFLRYSIDQEKYPTVTEYEPFSVDKMTVPYLVKKYCSEIYYFPNNPLTRKLTSRMNEHVFQRDRLNYTFRGFSKEELMLKSYEDSVLGFSGRANESTSPVLAFIIFENINTGKFKLPTSIRYTLRFPSFQRTEYDAFKDRVSFSPSWFTRTNYPPYRFSGPRSKKSTHGGFPGYYDEGFLYLQYAVESTITKLVLNSSQNSVYENVQLKLQRFPYPKYVYDIFMFFIQIAVPVSASICAVYPAMSITKQIIHEKANGLKEFTKIGGLSNRLHWMAWFIQSFIMLSISSIIQTAVFKIKFYDNLATFDHSDTLVLFVALEFYYFCLIGFAFLMSTLFSVAETGATGSGFVWLLTYVPYVRFFHKASQQLGWDKFRLSLLLPNLNLSFMYFCIGGQEVIGKGVQWDTFWEGPSATDTFAIGDSCLAYFITGSIYILLAIYIEQIYPGKYGVPLPWYFPFTKWYWTSGIREMEPEAKIKNANKNRRFRKQNPKSKSTNATIEQEPPNLKAGVEISQLTKNFTGKVAVNNLNLKMYENQVTSLLGHNGAGKTTTMSILTGMIRPSSGTAIVNSYDIRKDMIYARNSLGLCPQYNVLFENLTVEEHLQFYGLLKGLSRADLLDEIERMLNVLDLEDKRNSAAKNLSGGMRRKLCVGIAFLADSKVVLLDEPTAGMDIEARRSTWNLIQSEKIGRTVILSTHYMEEAEILGDRIAIMVDGQLECCGSSLFLKSVYGASYNLVMVKGKNLSVEEIQRTIESIIPTATFCKDVGSELHYTLPASSINEFPKLFHTLENGHGNRKANYNGDGDKEESMNIESYGVENPTMEDIFLRVGELAKERKEKQKKKQKIPNIQNITSNENGNSNRISSQRQNQNDEEPIKATVEPKDKNCEEDDRNSGIQLFLQQMKAMFKKKFLVSVRSWNLIALQFLIPIVMALYIMGLCEDVSDIGKEVPLTLDPQKMKMMEDTSVLLNCPNNLKACESVKSLCRKAGLAVEKVPEGDSISSVILENAEKNIVKFDGKYMLAFEEEIEDDLIETTTSIAPISKLKDSKIAVNSSSSSFSSLILKGMYSNQPFHTPPLALNFLSNTLLKYVGSKYTLTVTNHPLPATYVDQVSKPKISFNKWLWLGFSILVGMSFLSSAFIIFPINERKSKSRHLQFLSGVNCFVFWFTSWSVDFILFSLSALIMLLLLMITFVDELNSHIFIKGVFLCLLYGWATTFFGMFLSTFCTNAALAYSRLVAIKGFAGASTLFIVCILENPAFKMNKHVDSISEKAMALPNYATGVGFIFLELHGTLHKYCDRLNLKIFCSIKPKSHCCKKLQKSYYTWTSAGIGQNLWFMFFVGAIFLILLIVRECGILPILKRKIQNFVQRQKTPTSSVVEEFPSPIQSQIQSQNQSKSNGDSIQMEMINSDVAEENERICLTQIPILCSTDSLVLRNLTKIYKKKLVAVDSLNLGVKKGEIFGLLGTNGAGKTTVFKMLTGDISISLGDAYINSYSVKTELKNAHSQIGYCPQFDACLNELTGRETLTMFAQLKGIKEEKIPKVCTDLARKFLFTQFLDRQFGTYSGGNKRKLSAALAMIGNPSIIFLDEPSAGLDPEARRHVWNAILEQVKEAGTCVVISTHLMEECEALCSKLGIMVKGRFKCLGSPQHLKSKLCQGYRLIAQIPFGRQAKNQAILESAATLNTKRNSIPDESESEWQAILHQFHKFLTEKFPGCIFKDARPGFVEYQLSSENTKWSKIFASMEEAKGTFKLDAYSVRQVNLEHVFFECVQSKC